MTKSSGKNVLKMATRPLSNPARTLHYGVARSRRKVENRGGTKKLLKSCFLHCQTPFPPQGPHRPEAAGSEGTMLSQHLPRDGMHQIPGFGEAASAWTHVNGRSSRQQAGHPRCLPHLEFTRMPVPCQHLLSSTSEFKSSGLQPHAAGEHRPQESQFPLAFGLGWAAVLPAHVLAPTSWPEGVACCLSSH